YGLGLRRQSERLRLHRDSSGPRVVSAQSDNSQAELLLGAIVMQQPEPNLWSAREISDAIHRQTQVKIAPVGYLVIGPVTQVGIGQVQCRRRRCTFQSGDLQLRQLYAAGG